MTTAQISRITPPPSVEAVLGALTEETRIGQVDFNARLAPEPEPEETLDDTGDSEDTEDTGDTGLADEADEQAHLDSDDTDDTDDTDDGEDAEEETPVVVTLKAVPDVGAAEPRTRRAARRQPEPTPEPEAELEAEPEPEPEPEPEAVAPKKPAKAKGLGKGMGAKRRVPRAATAEPETEPEIVTVPRSVETVDERTVPAPLVERVQAPAHLEDGVETGHGLVMPDLNERPPSVEEIARLVVERMHDAELAMMRHLEAVEAEAARRCELLTAQAELDAELIRLNARREAHGIVTDARLRAEGRAEVSYEQQQLDELTESLSRFADVVDELRPATPRSPAGRTP